MRVSVTVAVAVSVSALWAVCGFAAIDVTNSTRVAANDTAVVGTPLPTSSTWNETPVAPAPATATTTAQPATATPAAAMMSNTAVVEYPAPHKKDSQLSVSLIAQSYTYKEPDINISISGTLPGVQLAYQKNLRYSPAYFMMAADYSGGDLTYDGYVQHRNGQRDPVSFSSTDSILGLQLGMGENLELGALNMVYSGGLGYRYLNDKGHNDAAYEREETYLYIPLVLALEKSIDRFTIRGGLEADLFLSGTNKTHLEDVDPSMTTLTFKQNSGSGTRIFARVTHDFDNNQLFGELSYRTWNVDASDKITYQEEGSDRRGYFVEPANKTTSLDLALGMIF